MLCTEQKLKGSKMCGNVSLSVTLLQGMFLDI